MKFFLLHKTYDFDTKRPCQITFACPKVVTAENDDDIEDGYTIIEGTSLYGTWSFRWLQHKNGSFAWMEFSLFVTPEMVEWCENQ